MKTAISLLLLGTLALSLAAPLLCPTKEGHGTRHASTLAQDSGHDHLMEGSARGHADDADPSEPSHDRDPAGCSLVMVCGATAFLATGGQAPAAYSATVRHRIAHPPSATSGTVEIESPPPRRV